ncbi:MAG: bifunctional 4-hydroxy-2-oxoglutarate aldolase/2-dehydro-3-deoxy-phosphogluconate aldolase [Chitinophagaceae bacterium]
MNTDQTIIRDALRRSLLVPVFYHENLEISAAVMSICFEEGIELFEYTNRGAMAARNFEHLQDLAQSSYPGNFLGIGTIKTAQEAEQFVKLRPAFVVSPLINPEVGDVCRENNIPWMPGCITPTEVFQASSHGASVVKIFPASLVGPSFIKALKAVFPDVFLMPTGGIRAERQVLKEWFDAGVLCVGMGSELLEKDLVQNKRWDELREKIRNARQVILSCVS